LFHSNPSINLFDRFAVRVQQYFVLSRKIRWDSINGKERTWKVTHTSGVHCFHLVFMNYD
jgi:hypothetical protein